MKILFLPMAAAGLMAFVSLCSGAIASPRDRTYVAFENQTGLPASHFSIYAVGYSTASKKMLASDGHWVPITRNSGKIHGHQIGPRGFSTVLERANPVDGGIVLLVGAPKYHRNPSVTFTDGGAMVNQPANPPSNQWLDGQGKLIYQFIELTQPSDKNPTIDISVVDGFVMPINALAHDGRRRLAQAGQPLAKIVNRVRVMSIYHAFLDNESIPPTASCSPNPARRWANPRPF